MQIVFPLSLSDLLTIVAQQAMNGILLKFFLDNVPFFRNSARPDWQKFTVAAIICFGLIVGATFITNDGLPTTGNGWYLLVVTALALLFTNQSAWGFFNAIPGLRDFFLALFGKQSSNTITVSSVGATTSLVKTIDASTTNVAPAGSNG